jgi:hypothetical protein
LIFRLGGVNAPEPEVGFREYDLELRLGGGEIARELIILRRLVMTAKHISLGLKNKNGDKEREKGRAKVHRYP